MRCANCNAELAPGEAFCGQCGTRVEPASQANAPQEMVRVCPKCGTVNGPDDAYCGECGERLTLLHRRPGSLLGRSARALGAGGVLGGAAMGAANVLGDGAEAAGPGALSGA